MGGLLGGQRVCRPPSQILGPPSSYAYGPVTIPIHYTDRYTGHTEYHKVLHYLNVYHYKSSYSEVVYVSFFFRFTVRILVSECKNEATSSFPSKAVEKSRGVKVKTDTNKVVVLAVRVRERF